MIKEAVYTAFTCVHSGKSKCQCVIKTKGDSWSPGCAPIFQWRLKLWSDLATPRCFLNVSYKAGVHTFVRLHRRRRQALDRDKGEVFRLFKMYEVVTRTICSRAESHKCWMVALDMLQYVMLMLMLSWIKIVITEHQSLLNFWHHWWHYSLQLKIRSVF